MAAMDERLSKVARLGDVNALVALLEEDPLILDRVSLSTVADNPLHIAALAGNTEFVKKMLRLRPSFALELNQDGLTPLHVASASGHVEVVRELLRFSPTLCLLKDKGGRTPLHYAAMKGRVYVIAELLTHYPQVIEEVTTQGETALHLAIKFSQFEALKMLIERYECKDLINRQDKAGNTPCQLAIASGQEQVLEFLQESHIVDVKEFQADSSQETVKNAQSTGSQSLTKSREEIWKDVQNGMIVAASIIATMTYQALLSPPGAIWKEGMKLDPKCIFPKDSWKPSFLLGPTNTCPSVSLYIFMVLNILGFYSSIFVMLSSTWPSVALGFMGFSIFSIWGTFTVLLVVTSPNGLFFLFLVLPPIVVLLCFVIQVREMLLGSAILTL